MTHNRLKVFSHISWPPIIIYCYISKPWKDSLITFFVVEKSRVEESYSSRFLDLATVPSNCNVIIRIVYSVQKVLTQTQKHKGVSTPLQGFLSCQIPASGLPSDFVFGPVTNPSSQFALCLSVQYFLPSHYHLAAPVSCLWVLISSAG